MGPVRENNKNNFFRLTTSAENSCGYFKAAPTPIQQPLKLLNSFSSAGNTWVENT